MFRNGYDNIQILNSLRKQKQPTPECDSVIGQRLSENEFRCDAKYNEDQFFILDTARSPFHLSLLEAT